MGVVLYIAIKLLAYCGWSYYGLQIFRPNQYPSFSLILGYGLFRFLLGLFFGTAIFVFLLILLSPILNTIPMQNVFAYLLIYIPIRWIEWAIVAIKLNPSRLSFEQAVTGANPSDRYWRLGGIAISCVADIPLIIFFGGAIPTGRFLC
ncbi:MAG TPA: hypothetical protein VN025_18910 [Candidatus Dormibacteraeota bacterium]|nr:hypothetical protein [Candidatus Dormibacteraeota bacterium]